MVSNKKKQWAVFVGEPTSKNTNCQLPKKPENNWFWNQVGQDCKDRFFSRQDAEKRCAEYDKGYGLWNYHAMKIIPQRKYIA